MSEEIKATQETKDQEVKQENAQAAEQEQGQEVKQEEIKEESKEQKQEQEKVQETAKEESSKSEKNAAKKDSSKKKEKTTTKKGKEQKQEKKQDEKQEKKQEEEFPPLKIKRFVNSSASTPISTLMYHVKRGKYNLNHSVQRKSEMWPYSNKESFLLSVLENVSIPEIIICTQGNNNFVIDGKQRLSCLRDFYFGLDPKLTLQGRHFADLDTDTQEFFKSRTINVIQYVDVDEKNIFSLFERYNSGVALSSSQKLRSYCTIRILDKIKELLAKPFIAEKCNITAGQKKKSEDETTILLAALLVWNFPYKNFSEKEINRYLKETEENNILAALETVGEHIDILDSIIAEKNKNLKKIHLPAILAFADDSEEFKKKLLNFLNNYDDETDLAIKKYRSHCQGSTSQLQQVQGRNRYWNN